MPDLSFGLIFLAGNYEPREMKFTLPPNVHFLSEVSLYDYLPHSFPAVKGCSRHDRREAFVAVKQLCFDLQDGHMASFDQVYEYLTNRTLSIWDLAYSPLAWRLLKTVYDARAR